MTAEATEKRLSELENRLNALQQTVNERLTAVPAIRAGAQEKKGWQAIIGTFAADPAYDEAMRLGREWRDTQRSDSTVEST